MSTYQTAIDRLKGAGLPIEEKDLWITLERKIPRPFLLFAYPIPSDGWALVLVCYSGDTIIEERGTWVGETLLEALAVFAFSKKHYNLIGYQLMGRDADDDTTEEKRET